MKTLLFFQFALLFIVDFFRKDSLGQLENPTPGVEPEIQKEVDVTPAGKGIDLEVVRAACADLDPINVDDVLEKLKSMKPDSDVYESAYEQLLMEVDQRFFTLQEKTPYLATSLMKNRLARDTVNGYLRRTLEGDAQAFFTETGLDPTSVLGPLSGRRRIAEAAFRKGLRTPARLDRDVYFKIASDLRKPKAWKTKTGIAAIGTIAATVASLLLTVASLSSKKGARRERAKKKGASTSG